MLRIVSCDCVTSFKYFKSKTTLPSIAIVCGVSANDTDVAAVSGPKRLRFAYLKVAALNRVYAKNKKEENFGRIEILPIYS